MKKKKLTPLQRAIVSRERGIERLKERVRRIWREAEADCAAIRKTIATRQFYLDAIKSGALEP